MSDAESLYDVAHELLVKAAAILDTTPAGAPTIQFVSHAPPPYDCCDTLAVHVGVVEYRTLRRGALSGTGAPDPRVPVMPQVPLTITALRCQTAVPTGGIQIDLPTAAQINADAQVVARDGWALFNGIGNAYRDGTLFEGFPCRVADVDALMPVAPEGGCLGWLLMVSVDLDGYTPA